MRTRFVGYLDFDTQKVFNKTENQVKNTIVTLGHNRKTHRTIAIQAVNIFKESYNFPETYVSYCALCGYLSPIGFQT